MVLVLEYPEMYMYFPSLKTQEFSKKNFCLAYSILNYRAAPRLSDLSETEKSFLPNKFEFLLIFSNNDVYGPLLID